MRVCLVTAVMEMKYCVDEVRGECRGIEICADHNGEERTGGMSVPEVNAGQCSCHS
jgi:hypothetical protein